MKQRIFLFGEAEKGAFCTPLICHDLGQLVDSLGNPPEESLGILYAIQTLLYDRELIFFRVKQEGFSMYDYMQGIKFLKTKEFSTRLAAICMPGVGDSAIIEAVDPICKKHHSVLILTEKDLYDYLTQVN